MHPGDPYELLKLVQSHLSFRRPSPAEAVTLLRSLGLSHLKPVAPPPQESPSRLRRTLEGVRHSLGRDAEAIHHHYDVSNTFYEHVLGPSMTYTCAVFPTETATLEEAQHEKYDLVARKLDLQPGQRLLDVGCGWGGMVRHAAREYGVHALGVTLSREQASWAQRRIKEEGLDHLAEVRFMDYRHVEETGFDAISLDRADRAHRGQAVPVVLRVHPRPACSRRAGCSTTASPGTTTGSPRPARSSTATSSRTPS